MGSVSALPPTSRVRILVCAVLVAMLGMPLLTLAATAAPARADVNDFTFESLDVEYLLGRADDGTSTLTVVETFVAVFPEVDQNRGMRRSIPDHYFDAPLNPHLVSIADEDGNPRPVETESEDGYYSMTSRADDYVHGRQTYVFTYTLENVARHFDDTGVDEFYWNVNGTEWSQPFGRVTARVTMSAEVADAATGAQACYVGYEGSTTPCGIAADGTVVEAATDAVAPYQTMTIAIGFDAGTFTEFDGSYLASPWGWAQGIVAVLGLGGALVLAGRARGRALKDEPGRSVIIAEYTPPAAVDALESAVLLGHTTKAIPAEVLEQAVAGSIRIEEGEKKWFGSSRLKAVLVDPSRADGDGRMLLQGLFPSGVPGDEFEFGRSDTRLSTAAQKILKAANQELVNRGLRRPVPIGARVWPLVVAAFAAVSVFFLGFAALEASVMPVWPIVLIIASVLVLLLVIGLVARKPLTAKGAEVRDHLKGLKVFIEWAEADRIRMLQSPQGAERVPFDTRPAGATQEPPFDTRPAGATQEPPVDTGDTRVMLKLYEALLPYAVVFGQEEEWARQLAVLYGEGNSPGWYSGSSGFSAAAFSSGISSLSSSTASSSSTSGGSSGGGSAGGGGGGGGGGGV